MTNLRLQTDRFIHGHLPIGHTCAIYWTNSRAVLPDLYIYIYIYRTYRISAQDYKVTRSLLKRRNKYVLSVHRKYRNSNVEIRDHYCLM